MSLTGPSLPPLPSSLSSVTADSSVPSTPTTLSTSSSGWRFLLAENRYEREEMLAPDQTTRPPMNSELESILLDEAITPLALLPLTEDEQVHTYFTAPHCGSGVRSVKYTYKVTRVGPCLCVYCLGWSDSLLKSHVLGFSSIKRMHDTVRSLSYVCARFHPTSSH